MNNLDRIKTHFSPADQVAWAGSGGKTTLIFNCARHCFSNCIITTSTHLGLNQEQLADRSFRSFESFKHNLASGESVNGIVLITNGVSTVHPEKLVGLTNIELVELSYICKEKSLPLFIEADGSKQKPIKAPADHEPAIPDFICKVCVVVGLEGIGKPINTDNVHRPETYKKIVGSGETTVTYDNLYRYLVHPEGGKKNIPEECDKYLFINQTDLTDNMKEVELFADRCTTGFNSVVLCQNKPEGLQILSIYHPIACIILAAGGASRYGSPKQLELWRGKPFIVNVIELAKRNMMRPVYVILGAHLQKIRRSIKHKDISIIENQDWQTGQSSSVQAGINALSKNTHAVIFLLVDQPQLSDFMIQNLKHMFAKTGADIIAHEIDESYRHPMLFSKNVFPYLTNLKGDIGGRAVFKIFPPLGIPIEDEILGKDVDTKADYIALKESRKNNWC